MAAAAEPVAETVLEATVATMRKIHLCKQAHQSAGARTLGVHSRWVDKFA